MKSFPRKRPLANESIEARAAAWLAQRDGGFSATDAAAFTAWRDADPRHAAAVARLEATWSALAQLRDFRPSARAHPDRDLLAPRRSRRVLAFPLWGLAAAAAALVVVALHPWSHSSFTPPLLSPPQVYTTTVGGYQRLTLADGSVVELNDNSEVRVHYTPGERHLQLVTGQAHFTVVKNKDRPFIVETRGIAVRAVGTAFDVRLASHQVEVLVTEGSVRLDRPAATNSRQPTRPSAEPPVLVAGWRAVIPHAAREELTLEMLGADRIRESLSWQGPRLVFVETPLAEVVAQFNRRNQVQLALADADLASLPVGGSFRAENVETFVRLLSSNGEILAERTAPNRIVLRKAR